MVLLYVWDEVMLLPLNPKPKLENPGPKHHSKPEFQGQGQRARCRIAEDFKKGSVSYIYIYIYKIYPKPRVLTGEGYSTFEGLPAWIRNKLPGISSGGSKVEPFGPKPSTLNPKAKS